MGKDDADSQQPKPAAGRRRRAGESSPESDASTPDSSASSSSGGSPLDLETGAFTAPKEPPPTRTADELAADADYEPPPPELIEWTPERAAAIVRGLGFGLHVLDPVGHADGAEDLWRWTMDDAIEAGGPLSRILNRYAPARRLAGYSDEAELTIIMGSYVRRNLADRGRILALQAELERQRDPEVWAREQPPDAPPGYVPPWGEAPPPEGA